MRRTIVKILPVWGFRREPIIANPDNKFHEAVLWPSHGSFLGISNHIY